MEIKRVPVSSIKLAEYNPREDLQPGDTEYEKLRKSILEFGYVEPLVWNKRTETLVSGHQRFKILKTQGLEEVEVSVVDLPLDKEKALNIALNKISGRWDEEKLASLLEELSQLPDFNVELTGFDLPEISELFDSQSEDREDDFDFQKALESIKEPITKKGDLIELGKHRLLCGDSSDFETLKLLVGNERVNLLHTDPPYNVNYYAGNRPNLARAAKTSPNWERIQSDHMNQNEYEVWLKKIFSNMGSFLEKGAAIYVWNGHKQFGPMYEMLEELGFYIACVITWKKPNFAIGFGDYNQQTEFCLYGWKNKNGRHAWYGPANESTLWEIKRDPTKEYRHPTQKALELARRAIRNSSKRGDIVLDLFLGSGTTLIASEGLNRRCFGMEIDPKYCDVIVRRYIEFMGESNVPKDLIDRYLVGK